MNLYKKLYIGDEVELTKMFRKSNKINYLNKQYYCIVLMDGHQHIEIYNVKELQKKIFQRYNVLLIGIAKNYEDAVDIIIDLTNDCLRDTEECNLVQFINQNKV